MKVANDERGRSGATPAFDASVDAMRVAQRFEMALHKGQGDGAEEQDDQQHQSSCLANPLAEAYASEPLAPNVMRLFRQSLEQGIPDARTNTGNTLSNLLRDIADTVRLGQRMSGDRWRFLLRLQDDVLAQTEMEIACTGGELSVVLRTADEEAYRRVVAALPELNATLAMRQQGEQRATVFWVGPAELR